eukprot:TRINITY_DN41477_c0_g1_i1.p1 TRINITY_DN41477_c0_g1~~TRINITY_DN41477_c0_g1_i1.p1  ORF type:complete len:228 (+),score=48.52 TRINITY_DN41477_c0_g1_i1:73-684(+)
MAMSRRVSTPSTRPSLRLAVVLSLCVAALLWSLPERQSFVQGRSSGTPVRRLQHRMRATGYSQDEDLGEFDFGEYEAPMGVSVMEAEEEEGPELAPPEAEVFLQQETGRYECQNCGYEYNPMWGVGDFGPGTQWKDLPVNFRCPTCRVSKDQFNPIVEEIAGFKENQEFGLGFNTWTGGQKQILIWGGLIGLAGILLSGYWYE